MTRDVDGSDTRFWAFYAEPQDGHLQPYGEGTVGIVDEEWGGVIAYCHKDNEERIIRALREDAGQL